MGRLRLIFIVFLFSCSSGLPIESLENTKPTSIKSAEILRHVLQHPKESDRESFAVKEAFPYQVPMQNFSVHPAHEGQINALLILLGGASAISGGQDGKLILSRITSPFVENRQVVETELLYQSSKPVLALAISPDERFLAIAQSGELRILDLRKRMIVSLLTHVTGRVSSLAWDPQNEFLLLGLANGEIFAWNFPRGPENAKNSLAALEFYLAGNSPIVEIIIHPVARSFFALERNGRLNLWRLQRAEIEQGGRDLAAIIDQDRKSQQVTSVASYPDQVYDMWYDVKASLMYVACADGNVHISKIRGLKVLAPFSVSRGEVFSLNALGGSALIALSTREQRIDFWCKSYQDKDAPELLFQSKIFPYTISNIASLEGSNYLWAGTKTGSLLSLEIDKIFSIKGFRKQKSLCAQ